jgi:hypothetical protein
MDINEVDKMLGRRQAAALMKSHHSCQSTSQLLPSLMLSPHPLLGSVEDISAVLPLSRRV